MIARGLPPSVAGLATSALALLALLGGCADRHRDGAREVPVHVGGVVVDAISNSPVVVLEEDEGERVLPISIGIAEARSIAVQIEDLESPRPNTHDLAKRLLVQLEARVERVVVTDLRSGIYYAVLVVQTNARRHEIDARPSDAIAIALRVEAPVFVRESLLEVTRAELEFEDEEDRLEL